MKKWIIRQLVELAESIIYKWGGYITSHQENMDPEVASSDIRVISREYVLNYKKDDLSPNPPYDVVFRKASSGMRVWEELGSFLEKNNLIEKEFSKNADNNLVAKIRVFIYVRPKKRK